ncbi:MAG: 50S ribosomal protein L23 [Chloroflexi bacterium]|nr:50S ribosomal protein L23 [Chloroflexota bacterium]
MRSLDVLLRPLVTEKSTALQEHGQYVFQVVPEANKTQVKEAVERAFSVHVVSVNVTKVPGEWRRIGLRKVFIPGLKKAVVTLRQGDTIQIFEGA